MKIKKFLVATAATLVLLTTASPAFAEKQEPVKTLEDSIFNGYQNKLSDGSKANYYLDVTTTEKAEEDDQNAAEEAIDNVSDFFTGKALEEKAANVFYEGKNMMANTIFRYNVFIVTGLINGLDMVFDHNVINELIDKKTESMIQGIAGVDSSGNFRDSGIVGSMIPVITSLAIIYALYLFAGKRAQLSAFQSIGSTIIVMALAIGFFANYGAVLKGANQLSTELSQLILTGPSKITTKQDKTLDEIRDEMYGDIWNQFVHRPYLFMQYGTDEEKDIGKKRIEELLKKKQGEKRLEYIEDKEVKDKKNINMTYANVDNRLIFTGFYSSFNTFNGIPFILLMLVLEGTQYWFLATAMLAPFVFAWAALPEQLPVLKRYSLFLLLPLIVKLGATIATYMYFTVSNTIYTLNSTDIGGYFKSGISMLAILFVLILMWKPIKRIFQASNQYKFIKREINEFKNSIQKNVETVTKVTGAVVGAALGGPAGAAAGAQFAQGLVDNSVDPSEEQESYSGSDQSVPTASLPALEPTQKPEIVDWQDNRATPEKAAENEPTTVPSATLPKVEEEQIKEPVEKNQPTDIGVYAEDEMDELATLPPLEEEKEVEGGTENESKG